MPAIRRKTNLPPERMTPILVRGKKGQRARRQTLKAKQVESTMIEASMETRGTPASAVHGARSRLESLPTEILETIFLHSQNFNLPEVSLTLCRALSSRHLRLVILRSCISLPCLQHLDINEAKELAKTQSALLRCRWFDHAMFRHAVDQLRAAALVRFFNEPGASDVRTTCPPEALLGPDCPISDRSSSTITHFIENISEATSSAISLLMEDQSSIGWKVEWTSIAKQRFRLYIFARGFCPMNIQRSDGTGAMLASDRLCKFEVAPGCQIPTKLLRGPWSESKKDFLRMMIVAGGTLDWETSNNGEVADKCLREAIAQGNKAVVYLLIYGWTLMPPQERSTFPDINGTRCSRCPISVTIDHLRLAVLEGGCSEAIVTSVMEITQTQKGCIEADEAIENWATEKKARGDARGKWLLDYLDLHSTWVRWIQ